MPTFPDGCTVLSPLRGSQPSPTYPPPPRWLYIIMAADLRDLLWKEPHLFMREEHWQYDIQVLHKEHPFMRHLVIHALSGESRSPLMSCWVDFNSAKKWIAMADANHRIRRGHCAHGPQQHRPGQHHRHVHRARTANLLPQYLGDLG